MSNTETDGTPNNCCQGKCEFHGQLWCKTWDRPCSDYCTILENMLAAYPELRNNDST